MSRLLGLRRGREMVKMRHDCREGSAHRTVHAVLPHTPHRPRSPAGIRSCGFDRSGEAIDAEAGRPLVVEAGDRVPARDATQRATHAAVWPVQRQTTGMDRLLRCCWVVLGASRLPPAGARVPHPQRKRHSTSPRTRPRPLSEWTRTGSPAHLGAESPFPMKATLCLRSRSLLTRAASPREAHVRDVVQT
jgi:hypothetical protein